MEGYDFYAATPSGHTIKVLAETLNSCLSNQVCLTIKDTGIYSSSADSNETILISFELQMENFDEFRCTKPKTFSLNLKTFVNRIKTIKKKDSMILFIKKNENRLGIRIISNSPNKSSDRTSEDFIGIQDAVVEDYTEIKGYQLPKVISSSDFQKVCKKLTGCQTQTKVFSLKIQKNNYAQFRCDTGDKDNECKDMFGSLDKLDKEIYENKFYISTFTQLIKMSGLSTKMQLYAPQDKTYPIKIKSPAGTIGSVEIYIKSKAQIDLDEKQKA